LAFIHQDLDIIARENVIVSNVFVFLGCFEA